MNYENSKSLTDVKFKRLVGVQRETFAQMLQILNSAYVQVHKQGGRTPKLSLEDLLMATLQYLREYRSYEQIAADFGIHESNLIRRSKWAEEVLIKNGFHIEKGQLHQKILYWLMPQKFALIVQKNSIKTILARKNAIRPKLKLLSAE